MRRMAGEGKWPVTPTTDRVCSARSTAAAIRSSTGLELSDAQIAQMLRQGTWYVPTLQVYYTDWDPADTDAGKRDRKRVALHGVSFGKALRAGVKMAFGTDVGGFKWSQPIAEEFLREVQFGMTPMQAIQSATSRAAELLGQAG